MSIDAALYLSAYACATAAVTTTAGLRWLRVAQREHYIPGSASRFAMRWWASSPANRVALATLITSLAVAAATPTATLAVTAVTVGLVTAVAITCPRGLPLRGRTSKLNWTRRLKTLAAVAAALHVLLPAAALIAGAPGLAVPLLALISPLLIDAALALTAPLEKRASAGYVTRARQRLATVNPTVVAITGSYGKTSTKVTTAHLLSHYSATVASPASFNNTNGLARTVNEHLTDGTQTLVAEMGTYGPGEIAAMCAWIPPKVAVITAIGPVHLERMKTLDNITSAKAEICQHAQVAVLNVDYPHLSALADQLPIDVVRCSATDPTADVHVHGEARKRITVQGEDLGEHDAPGHAGNIACAIGTLVALGHDPRQALHLLATVPAPKHRLNKTSSAAGVVVLDDTFNANPASVRSALSELARTPAQRRVLVTPGIVELGPDQPKENAEFAKLAGDVVDELIVVGRTNAKALQDGAAGRCSVLTVPTRQQAVEWVRAHLNQGDAVLYVNDLPDHYA